MYVQYVDKDTFSLKYVQNTESPVLDCVDCIVILLLFDTEHTTRDINSQTHNHRFETKLSGSCVN
jgi:hypothetical protein